MDIANIIKTVSKSILTASSSRGRRLICFLDNRNGKGDTVLMDIEMYSRREDELAFTSRLLESERRWLAGETGYTIEQLDASLNDAIKRGTQDGSWFAEDLRNIRAARLNGAKGYSLSEIREVLTKTIENVETAK